MKFEVNISVSVQDLPVELIFIIEVISGCGKVLYICFFRRVPDISISVDCATTDTQKCQKHEQPVTLTQQVVSSYSFVFYMVTL